MAQEKASITQSDKIRYLDPDKFESLFLRKNKALGSGAIGTVFTTVGNLVIKQYPADFQLTDLIRELNIYASGSHPCLMKPRYWTSIAGIGYLAMPKGSDIKDAYREEKKISIDIIIRDSLSAIAFLNKRGIAHRDIKFNNLVYYNNKCVVIDLNVAQQAELHSDNQYYITDIAYIPSTIDPEYSYTQYNSIKSEIYALGATCLTLYKGDLTNFGELSVAAQDSIEAKKERDKMPKTLAWFVEESGKLVQDRLDIVDLLNTLETKYELTSYPEKIFDLPELITQDNDLIPSTMIKLVRAAYALDVRVETLFLALTLFQRCFTLVKDSDSKEVELFGYVILSLAMTVNVDVTKDISYFRGISRNKDPNYETTFHNMIIKVLRETGGIITTLTHWNYAKSRRDLLPFLRDIINSNYNPRLIGEVVENSNKCITVQDFIIEEELESLSDFVVVRYKNSLSRRSTGVVHSCELDLKESSLKIENIWAIFGSGTKIDILVGVVLHNRSTLEELPLRAAKRIFNTFYKGKEDPFYQFVFRTIYGTDWKRKIIRITDDMHPFAVLY
jgi:serine/threonine protein kinase